MARIHLPTPLALTLREPLFPGGYSSPALSPHKDDLHPANRDAQADSGTLASNRVQLCTTPPSAELPVESTGTQTLALPRPIWLLPCLLSSREYPLQQPNASKFLCFRRTEFRMELAGEERRPQEGSVTRCWPHCELAERESSPGCPLGPACPEGTRLSDRAGRGKKGANRAHALLHAPWALPPSPFR